MYTIDNTIFLLNQTEIVSLDTRFICNYNSFYNTVPSLTKDHACLVCVSIICVSILWVFN